MSELFSYSFAMMIKPLWYDSGVALAQMDHAAFFCSIKYRPELEKDSAVVIHLNGSV